MKENESLTLGDLSTACKDLNDNQKAYLRGVVDGMKASKEKEEK